MANTVNRAVIYSTLLDESLAAGVTSAPLEAGAAQIKYDGSDTVKIANISTTGFGNYDRTSATAYPAGTVTNTWESYSISMDRAVKFTLEIMDENETMGVMSATNTISSFNKDHAVPEVDSYRFSKIFQSIVDDSTVRYSYYTPAEATILGTIQGKIADIQDVVGENTPLVCFISGQAFKYLTQSTQLSKQLGVQSVSGANGITTKIYDVDGVQLIPVPSARMKTEYAFSSTNGFSAKAWAQDINFIVMAKSAAVAFKKYVKTRIVPIEYNPDSDGDILLSRIYHDLWVYDNKHAGISISLKTATIAGFSAAELSTTGATNVTYTIASYATRDTGHKFYYFDGGSAAAKTAPACYDEFDTTGYVEIISASAVADVVSSGYYGALVELDENGRAVRFETIKAA